MESMYPYIEYAKVLAAYAALFYVWPGIIFRRYLRDKGLAFRFMFCSTVVIVLCNGVILGLGLFRLLHTWLVRILFWGTLILSVMRPMLSPKRQTADRLSKQRLKEIIREKTGQFGGYWQTYKEQAPEYLMLTLLLLFGMAYFSIGMLHDYSYGCYDHYTHYRWITELNQGRIFTEGIYPGAMHCFVYGIRYLFGVDLHSSMLFLAGIHISAFLLAAYCLLKEIFRHRCMPLFVLTAWLTYDLGIQGQVMHPLYLSIARLTWTYPQEFGMYLVFLCPVFLIRFFRRSGERSGEVWSEDENLILLMLGVGAAVSMHFYLIIFAFFLCLPAVVVFFGKMLSLQQIQRLLYAVGFGVGIGALPMALAYIMGAYLEKSLRWGMGRFHGVSEDAVNYSAGGNHFLQTEGNGIKELYEKGYAAILGDRGAAYLVGISLFLVVITGMCCLYLNRGHGQEDRKRMFTRLFRGYSYLVLASVSGIFLYAAPYMGLPEFIAVDRIFSIIKMLILGVAGAAGDLVLVFVSGKTGRKSRKGMVVWGCAAVYCLAYMTDFHEYLYSVMTRYNAQVNVTNAITKQFSGDSYRIISMEREKGQMEEAWRHGELLDFVCGIEKEEYRMPVEYMFLYVEKHPIVSGQIHYFTGPAWLADASSLFSPDEVKSQCPDILRTDISWEAAQREITYELQREAGYADAAIRTALCSKAYYWYQEFSERYPSETGVYYEDEDFVCYMIHQDRKEPLNLSSAAGQRE